MKVARLLGFLLAALILIAMAHADGGPVTMVFRSVNGVNDGQYYVSPYSGTMQGQTVTLFCDDVLNDVNFGQTWQANVTNLDTAIQNNNFSQTLRPSRKPHGSPHNSDPIPATIRICNTRCGS
jgi:hypothetical protein